MTPQQTERLRKAVKEAVGKVGRIDFISPGGVVDPNHPYSILSELGINKVSLDTFWLNLKRIKAINYEYQIFGCYLNNVRFDELGPERPYYFVSDVFENSELWSDKKGLLLYPQENKALIIAEELVAYSKKLPHKSDFKSTDSNSAK